jgi:regulatory protein
VARSIVLRQLAAGPRTRAQLQRALDRRGVPADAAEQVLDRFSELGYVDDAAFAQAWVQSRQRGRGLARRALAHELRQRGVDDDVARDVLDAMDPQAERAAAEDLVRRRLSSLRNQPDDVKARRLSGLLARKGYPPGLAQSVVRNALADQPLATGSENCSWMAEPEVNRSRLEGSVDDADQVG